MKPFPAKAGKIKRKRLDKRTYYDNVLSHLLNIRRGGVQQKVPKITEE